MRFLLFIAFLALQSLQAADFHATACEGVYPRHLQGICTNDKDAIYWCWTDVLVKTDTDGRVLKKVPVANHHGDLCFHNGRVYVATNLAKFIVDRTIRSVRAECEQRDLVRGVLVHVPAAQIGGAQASVRLFDGVSHAERSDHEDGPEGKVLTFRELIHAPQPRAQFRRAAR